MNYSLLDIFLFLINSMYDVQPLEKKTTLT